MFRRQEILVRGYDNTQIPNFLKMLDSFFQNYIRTNHNPLKNCRATLTTSSSYTQLFLVLVIMSISFISVFVIQHDAFAMTNSVGVIIPLYSYPGSDWDTMIQAKNAHPSVPMLAVINPSNGPGSSPNSNYASGIQQLQSAGITVLGYVYTSYGSRSISLAEADINSYSTWYHVNGILFDEMSNVAGHETYYSTLSNYAKSHGMTMTVGNPGTDTLSSYSGTVDNLVIYDNSGLPNMTLLGGWHKNFDKNNFSVVSFEVNSLDKTFVKELSNNVGYLYVTDKKMPNHFNSLPTYFDDLIKTLDSTQQQQSSTSSSVPLSITIKSSDLQGNPIIGLWISILSNGNTIQSGFTPFSFTVPSSNQYAIITSNYKTTTFNHWDDGSTNSSKAIMPKQNVTLTAYYKTGSQPVSLVQPVLQVKLVPPVGFSNFNYTLRDHYMIFKGQYTNGDTPYTVMFLAVNFYEQGRLVAIANDFIGNIDKHETRPFSAVMRDPKSFDSYTVEIKSTIPRGHT